MKAEYSLNRIINRATDGLNDGTKRIALTSMKFNRVNSFDQPLHHFHSTKKKSSSESNQQIIWASSNWNNGYPTCSLSLFAWYTSNLIHKHSRNQHEYLTESLRKLQHLSLRMSSKRAPVSNTGHIQKQTQINQRKPESSNKNFKRLLVSEKLSSLLLLSLLLLKKKWGRKNS